MIKYHKIFSNCERKRSNLLILTGLLRHFIPRNDRTSLIILSFFFFSLISGVKIFAQSTRGLINDGVDYYEDSKFFWCRSEL